MNEQAEIEWLAEKLEDSAWLFYGEFEGYLGQFLRQIFQKEPSDYGFDESLPNDFQVAYWSVISEMERLRWFEYGTSPRGGWLTKDGKRFKQIIMTIDDALVKVANFTYEKYNG